MTAIPAISGLPDPLQARVMLYQSGRQVHAPAARIGLLPGVTPLMFDAIGDGSADDSTAWRSAIATGLPVFGGGPQYTYRIDSEIELPDNVQIDLQGATIKPTGATRTFIYRPSTSLVLGSTTVSSGAAVGQIVQFSNNDANYESGSWPPSWSVIENIAGTTIKLTHPFGFTYSAGGTTTMYYYAATTFAGRCRIVNGIIDGSDCTYTTAIGSALHVNGYGHLDIDLEIRNFVNVAALFGPVEIVGCQMIRWAGSFTNCVHTSPAMDMQSNGTITITDLTIDVSSTCLEILRADELEIGTLLIRGQRLQEIDAGTTGSVRGLKLLGCANAVITNLIAKDLDSGVKFQSSFRTTISNVQAINCGAGGTIDHAALNLGSGGTTNNQSYLTIGNVVIEGGGSGLVCTPAASGQITINSLIVRDVLGTGAYFLGPNIHVVNAIIENWDMAASGNFGVLANLGGCFDNLTFLNPNDNTRLCMYMGSAGAGHQVAIGNVRNPDGNPLFQSSQVIQNSGTATIVSGTTAIAVTHSLINTPAISEIVITPSGNPTVDPGHTWVDTITSTQFTIRCRVDPTSNYTIGWRAKMAMPFTA
jgi:hypothetical protein